MGLDFAILQAAAGASTLLVLAAVADVRVVEGRSKGPTTGDGAGQDLGVRLADVLAQAAGQRPRVAVQAGAASVVGDLRAVGRDVLTLRTDARELVYVGLASVSEISFLASG